ncbi:MAG TPA: hypothetical protein VK787_07285 [Puia sp.]|jgi:G:T/U-mismatch repair DNA glycosylase|nr:hypothetical protein [Puia sp.]
MPLIRHRFAEHKVNTQTEVLVIGTFNPEASENKADFFYGRDRNFLWTLIPSAFGDVSLKGKSKKEKLEYINKRKIDFIDLITEVNVDKPDNYHDAYLDKKVSKWTDVISEIEKFKKIKRVCFTRKTFSDIPIMKIKVEEIEAFCKRNDITFQCLTTPARFYRADKQQEWSNFLNDDPRL